MSRFFSLKHEITEAMTLLQEELGRTCLAVHTRESLLKEHGRLGQLLIDLDRAPYDNI